MSKYQELPQETLDGMPNSEVSKYYKLMDDKALRDKYAMAALTGLLATGNGGSAGAVEEAFSIANKCMIERDK